MARKTTAEIQHVFKTAFETQKGQRTAGWDASDSEQVVTALVAVQADKNGKELKLSADSLERIKAALRITPQRIFAYVSAELDKAGITIDDTSKELILKVLDVTGFRTELVKNDLLKSAGKGKRKSSIADILK